jgi:hypothetical protein
VGHLDFAAAGAGIRVFAERLLVVSDRPHSGNGVRLFSFSGDIRGESTPMIERRGVFSRNLTIRLGIMV